MKRHWLDAIKDADGRITLEAYLRYRDSFRWLRRTVKREDRGTAYGVLVRDR